MAIFALLILGAFGGLDPCDEATQVNSLTDDPFDPSSNSYDWINSNILPPFNECSDGADNEGDGMIDVQDYDCFSLEDSDGNGICDMRVYVMGAMEDSSDEFFTSTVCTGFEGCISSSIQEEYALSQGFVKA